MLLLKSKPPRSLDELKAALQGAMQLELATLPPYLTAYYTLQGNSPAAINAREILREIVQEEMLHLTLAGNILSAIGGVPRLNDPNMVPRYPGVLPMGIGDDDGDAPGSPLKVGIRRYSTRLIHDVFMAIEEPEKPLQIPSAAGRSSTVAMKFQTIGQFYNSIMDVITKEGDSLFKAGRVAHQVTGWFATEEEITVHDAASAMRAIEVIVEQGEGTPQRPIDFQGRIPHYYQFESLWKEMKAVVVPVTPANPMGVIYDASQPLRVSEAEILPMADDPPLIDLGVHGNPFIFRLSNEFDWCYSRLLNVLQIAFSGTPTAMRDAVGIMHELKNLARELMQQTFQSGPLEGQRAGPRFRYVASL
jgi:hypothetical protein